MFYLHIKGEDKTLILDNENSNISFYLYKRTGEQLLHLRNVEFVDPFILNVGPFLYGNFFFFSCLRPQAFACLA